MRADETKTLEVTPFYFNGELMPAWGASWSLAGVADFLDPASNWDEDYGHRDVWLLSCSIDHLGTVESSDPEAFIYCVQEVLLILLKNREEIIRRLESQRSGAPDVYAGMVAAIFEMRKLTERDSCAFWVSGSEQDLMSLREWMRRSRLPEASPDYLKPPHQRRKEGFLKTLTDLQVKSLHRLAQDGNLDKALRKALYSIQV